MKTCKILVQRNRRGVFAEVTVSSLTTTDSAGGVSLSEKTFEWMEGSHGPGTVLPSDDDWMVISTLLGAKLALEDLSNTGTQVVVERIMFHLVDATVAAFALAGYEATHEELSGGRRYSDVSEELLSEMKRRAEQYPGGDVLKELT